jgi:hypothetical protein
LLLTHPDLRYSARVRVFLDFLAADIGRHRTLIEGGSPAPVPEPVSCKFNLLLRNEHFAPLAFLGGYARSGELNVLAVFMP